MIFSLEVRRALKGDCLLLHFGTADEPELAIIDGGPATVYKDHLLPRLKDLRTKHQQRLEESGEGEDDEPLPVRMVMVSHVDDDHIQGILDLTRDLKTKNKRLLRTPALWHNSFEDLLGEAGGSAVAQFGAAAMTSEPPDEDDEALVDTYKVLASIPQGQKLRGDAGTLAWTLNPEFDEGLITAGKDEYRISKQLGFVVIGPMQPEIDKLQKAHAKWAAGQLKKRRRGVAALAAYNDPSVANLSSVVVLARFKAGAGKKKTMLLTGDARGDKILKGLEHAGVVAKGGSLHVNILKMPHHGSDRNVEPDFFERITADHYVFSGNGEHGNPERDTLRMLLEARAGRPLTIHLTYPIDDIDEARKHEWAKQRASEIEKKAAGTLKKSPRKAWSHAEHSLAALFEQHPLGKKQALIEVPAKTPHSIDLLDRLRF